MFVGCMKYSHAREEVESSDKRKWQTLQMTVEVVHFIFLKLQNLSFIRQWKTPHQGL
jgi:hypothetical protein